MNVFILLLRGKTSGLNSFEQLAKDFTQPLCLIVIQVAGRKKRLGVCSRSSNVVLGQSPIKVR
jgi:hypothetical protein